MTLRQVYYRLVSLNLPTFKNTKRDYRRLSVQLTLARKKDEIPWAWMVDPTRVLSGPNVFRDPEEFMEAASTSYLRDLWQDQQDYVEVWSEKEIVESIVDLTDSLRVGVRVTHGFNSTTGARKIAQLFSTIDKPIHVLYLGDHDPSGRCIGEEISGRVQDLGSPPFQMERLAIHADDIREYKLQTFDAGGTKEEPKNDPRLADFREKHGEKCVELDALPPKVLRARIRKAVKALQDKKAWAKAVAKENREQARIRTFMRSWPTRRRK